MKWFKKKRFEFEHPEKGAKYVVKARDLETAKRKMRKFVIARMYGGWALIYNTAAVDSVMTDLIVRELP